MLVNNLCHPERRHARTSCAPAQSKDEHNGKEVMKVGIIGSGDVGTSLARGFASRGHEVTIGSRDPAKLRDFAKENANVRAGTFEEVARFGELLVVATAFDGTKSALDISGPANFAGKVVIDTTNPLKFEEGRLPGLSIGFDDSAGESIQRWLPGAKVVKAFNIIGHNSMVDPAFEEGAPTMFICGDDAAAKTTVTEVLQSFGWRSIIDAGTIEQSRLLEPLCILWVHYAVRAGSRNHAFKLLTR